MKSLVKHYTKQNIGEPKGPITLVSGTAAAGSRLETVQLFIVYVTGAKGKNRRLTFFECPNDLNSMIDIAKVLLPPSFSISSICLSARASLSLWCTSLCIIFFSARLTTELHHLHVHLYSVSPRVFVGGRSGAAADRRELRFRDGGVRVPEHPSDARLPARDGRSHSSGPLQGQQGPLLFSFSLLLSSSDE